VVDLRSVIGEERRRFASVRWRGRSWEEEASAVEDRALAVEDRALIFEWKVSFLSCFLYLS